MDTNEIILYQSDTLSGQIEVRIEDETVWLNRQQISLLFDRDIKTIGKHVNNALKEELKGIAVVAKFATTAIDGKVYQMEHYNLDMILYRIQYTVTRQPITENRMFLLRKVSCKMIQEVRNTY